MDLYKYEKELYENNINIIGGVDEVGRGPLVGPVVAACVVLPKDFKLDGLTDSKKLSEKKRDLFYEYIINNCLAYSISIVDHKTIDEINIYQASKQAMIEAISEVSKQINLEHVLIDAMPLILDLPSTSIIHGDALSISIAAASVVAKVTRDRLMYDLSNKYPMYGFDKHKGYPTKAHLEAIKTYGIFDGYRLTYGPIKQYINMQGNKENI